MERLTLNDIEKMWNTLDEAHIPSEGRILRTTVDTAYTILTEEMNLTHAEAMKAINMNLVEGDIVEFRS